MIIMIVIIKKNSMNLPFVSERKKKLLYILITVEHSNNNKKKTLP